MQNMLKLCDKKLIIQFLGMLGSETNEKMLVLSFLIYRNSFILIYIGHISKKMSKFRFQSLAAIYH